MSRDYAWGDQVEARFIVWWNPGDDLGNARCVATWWRGDTAVETDVGKVMVWKGRDELVQAAAAFVDLVYRRHLAESHTPRDLDRRRD